MNLKEDFNFHSNKLGYTAAIMAVLGVVIAIKLGMHLYPGKFAVILWMIFPTMFIPSMLVGETKLTQAGFAIEHAFYAVIVISLATLILANIQQYLTIYIAALIFACIALPWFRVGTLTTSIFLAVYVAISLMMHNMNLYDATNYVSYIYQATLSYLIGVSIAIILAMLLPLNKIPVLSAVSDNYQLIRALRLSIAVAIALIIAQSLHVYNAAWICFAVIVIAQSSLGDSMFKAAQRLLGTALGVVAGLLFAHYIASAVQLFSFSALIFLFLAMLFIKRNYTISLFFFTLLLAASFYLFKRSNLSVEDYLLARLLDTFIGLLIGVLCEALILPRSYLIHLRNNLCLVYRDLWFLMIVLKGSCQQKDIEELLSDIKVRLEKIRTYMVGIRFEPIVLMMRRYKYFKNLPVRLEKLEHSLEHCIGEKQLSAPTVEWIQQVFNIMRNIYINNEKITKQGLQVQVNSFAELSKTVSESEQELLIAVKTMIDIYLKMYSMNKWLISLR